MADLVDSLQGVAEVGEREIASFQRVSAETSVRMVRLLREAADTIERLSAIPSQPSEGWRDAIEAAAKVAEQWNGETADGNTIFIAEAIRALNPPLPEPPATPEKQGGGMG
jgi:hypothetical protein